MKILFVEPVILVDVSQLKLSVRIMDLILKLSKRFLSNNLTLQQLAAVTPEKHTIHFIDERFEDINFEEECDIVGITSTTYFATRAYDIADEFRKRGKTVVIGGYHPSALPEEAKEHTDSVVIGEAEELWPQLLEDFENNRLKPFYCQIEKVNPKNIPAPKRDIAKKKLWVARVQATRGCPYNCSFCSIPKVQGNQLRKRDIDEVIDEIKSLPQKFIIFSDASLTIDVDYTKQLFRRMIGLKKKFCCCGNVDVLAKDEELLELSKKAGCIAWYVGFESFNQDILNKIGKTTNKVEDYKTAVEKIHLYKMAVVGSFISGFDEETPESFNKLLDSINDLKIEVIEYNYLTPFPGTPLYDKLVKEGRIISRDWERYWEGEVVFRPERMTPEELHNNCQLVFWKIIPIRYSWNRLLRSMKLGFYPCFWTIMQNSSWV